MQSEISQKFYVIDLVLTALGKTISLSSVHSLYTFIPFIVTFFEFILTATLNSVFAYKTHCVICY